MCVSVHVDVSMCECECLCACVCVRVSLFKYVWVCVTLEAATALNAIFLGLVEKGVNHTDPIQYPCGQG